MYKKSSKVWQRIKNLINPPKRGKKGVKGKNVGGSHGGKKVLCNWCGEEVGESMFLGHLRYMHNLTGTAEEILKEADPKTSVSYHKEILCKCNVYVKKGALTIHRRKYCKARLPNM